LNVISKANFFIRFCIKTLKYKQLLYEEKDCFKNCLNKIKEVDKIVALQMKHLGAEKLDSDYLKSI